MNKTKEPARRVRLCRYTPRGSGPGDDNRGRGGRPILYAFSWADLGALFGLRPETARKLARDGKFDPTDLTSIAEFWRARTSNSKERR